MLLALNNAGEVVAPKKRTAVYNIDAAWDYRADDGRLEYWKVFAHLEDVKYLNPPSYGNV